MVNVAFEVFNIGDRVIDGTGRVGIVEDIILQPAITYPVRVRFVINKQISYETYTARGLFDSHNLLQSRNIQKYKVEKVKLI